MELNSSRFFTAVSVDILNFDNLGHVLDNLDKAVDLIDLNDIDELLLEEFCKPDIHFIKEFWILAAEFLHLDS